MPTKTPEPKRQHQPLRKATAYAARTCRAFLLQDVDENDYMLEIELLTLAIAAGINDAATFADYHLFTSNQTGNTVLLAVGVLGLGGSFVDVRSVSLSLALFIAGGCIFGQLGNLMGRRRRLWLLATNLFQTVLTFIATVFRKWVAGNDRIPQAWSVITVLAFASGAQVAAARSLNVPEITTAMVTSAYIDLLIDRRLLDPKNRPRNRRFLFVMALLGGSFIGAAAYKYAGPVVPFLMATSLKAFVCIAIFFNHQAPLPDEL